LRPVSPPYGFPIRQGVETNHSNWQGRNHPGMVKSMARIPLDAAHPSAPSRPGWEIVDFAQVAGVDCPCGTSRRALADVADFAGSIHQVDISLDAQLHYHKQLTETYYFLECEPDARMQLNDEIIPVRPGMCIMIRPGVRHRALGRMRVLNVVYPKFDSADEWFD